MVSTVTKICDRIIEYSFYAIFLLIPLAFTSTTSELFEFNKMWLTFGITWVIAASWFSKMILQRRIFIQKTPLDIPIALFLMAHIISTLFSIDQHISVWGYYSRFNGGLFSIITYIFLYYAFVSNFLTKDAKVSEVPNVPKAIDTSVVKRSLYISLASATIVALWGLPSHFGYDPTCFLFRGTFDVSCWTDAFQPKVRIFSTLGQPNWMAAYLSILLPLALAFGMKNYELRIKNNGKSNNIILASLFFILSSLFYIDIIYTGSQSGFVGAVVGIFIFISGYLYLGWQQKIRTLKIGLGVLFVCGLIAFFIGSPIGQLNKFTFPEIQKSLSNNSVSQKAIVPTAQAGTALEGGGGGGTNSGTIRQNVWTGAIAAWKANPLFGTGVETFAFAYYSYRPSAHNMTSEWDYLYNKAHNEYLNYLATTGILGLGSYLLMIGMFLWITVKSILGKSLEIRNLKLEILSLLAGYVSMLIINFFGFSVVITNIYLFMIPAFVFILAKQLIPGKSILPSLTKTNTDVPTKKTSEVTSMQWIGIIIISGMTLIQLWTLLNFWYADQAFALAQNYNRIGQYNEGYKKIREAITLRGDEPTFREELATSDAIVAVALTAQKQENTAKQLANEAIQTSMQLTTNYPHNINFLKSEVRVYYTLSQLNPVYLKNALETMKKIAVLAPTDAKISYNLGVLYGQNGETQKGIDTLQKTVQLKPDYRDAYFALGLFYHDLAEKDPQMQEKALDSMQYILDHFGKNDQAVLDTLKNWGVTP